jgi:hypothetical protein
VSSKGLTRLVLISIVSVLILDPSFCFSCGADEPFSPTSADQGPLLVLEKECHQELDPEGETEFICPLCVSRLFSPLAKFDFSSSQVGPFRINPLSFHEQESCRSIFRPPQV